ncbi:MAG: hypothetical protein MZV70_63635 [Desulfobacterales bacterium]|nr:hypothetical protein [Desulfobacterales bacterium]
MSELRIRSFNVAQALQWFTCGLRLWRRRPREATVPVAVFALLVLALRAIPVLGDVLLLLILPSVVTSYLIHVHVLANTRSRRAAGRETEGLRQARRRGGCRATARRCSVPGPIPRTSFRWCWSGWCWWCSADRLRPVQCGRRPGSGEPVRVLRTHRRADAAVCAGVRGGRVVLARCGDAAAVDAAAVRDPRHRAGRGARPEHQGTGAQPAGDRSVPAGAGGVPAAAGDRLAVLVARRAGDAVAVRDAAGAGSGIQRLLQFPAGVRRHGKPAPVIARAVSRCA